MSYKKVNEDDFTRGPGEIKYVHNEDKLKGFCRRREDLLRRLETATRGELTPFERGKGGIEDYTTTQEAEDLRQYKKFLATSEYDVITGVNVPPYQGEEI